MRLKKLLKDLDVAAVHGSKEVEINGICADSRMVAPGNLFVARKGRTVDGIRFIPDAIASGAVAVLSDLHDPSLKGVTQLIHPDIGVMEALLAAGYYNHPSRELYTVGITGTNGKTTVASIARQLLQREGKLCGMIGTVGYYVGSQRYEPTHTTPEVTRNHRLLREMCRNGCEAAVIEATSHGLDQGRLREIDFDIGVFTNLTVDHLDYHDTMESYCAAKARLFQQVGSDPLKQRKGDAPMALINGDDPWSQKLLEHYSGNRLSYGCGSGCQLRASTPRLTASGSDFEVLYQTQRCDVRTPLLGLHNVYNCLAAIGIALHRGLSLEDACSRLAVIEQVPGRLERVSHAGDYSILVDYAHTPDALEQCLKIVRDLTKRRLITVFGCGGDRDKSKRGLMGRIGERYSDLAVVTSDNPRSEDPETICREVMAGMRQPFRHRMVVDRRQAIESALSEVDKGDTVLIAGRGHESLQLIGGSCRPFDDREVAQELAQQVRIGAG